MIQITPQMKILVALEPADFRKGIDGLASVCKDSLQRDPFEGTVFVFRNRRRTVSWQSFQKLHPFCLCQKRMSEGKFRWWPTPSDNELTRSLAAHQLQVLFSAGNPNKTSAAPDWRPITPKTRSPK